MQLLVHGLCFLWITSLVVISKVQGQYIELNSSNYVWRHYPDSYRIEDIFLVFATEDVETCLDWCADNITCKTVDYKNVSYPSFCYFGNTSLVNGETFSFGYNQDLYEKRSITYNQVKGLTLQSLNGNVSLIGTEMSFVMSVINIGETPTFTWDFGGGFQFEIYDPTLSLLGKNSSYNDTVYYTFHEAGSNDVIIHGTNQHKNVSAVVTIEVKGNCTAGNITFTLIDDSTLVNPTSFLARLPIHVTGIVQFGCGHSSVGYSWQLFMLNDTHPYPNSANLIYPNDTDVQRHENQLSVAVLGLDYGAYAITLEATATYLGLTVGVLYKQGFIKVKPLPLVSLIKGGSSRSVNTNDTVHIDASLSYDPDVDVQQDDVLRFEWSCSKFHGNCELPGLSNCTEEAFNGTCITWSSDTSLVLTDNNFTVPNSALNESDTYVFTVTISKGRRDPVSFSQVIIVVPAEKPNVQVLCLQNCKYKVTSDSKISMAAHCTNCQQQSDLSFDWSIGSLGCNFTMDWATMSFTEQSSQAVSFKPGIFPKGCSFILTVTGVKKSGAGLDSGFASFGFTTNTPPIAPYSSCTVLPSIGVTLFDEFDIHCEKFQDEDIPVTYEFYYKKDSDNAGSMLGSSDASELQGVQLAPGDSANNYTVEIHINATDYLQTTTMEVVTLQVYPYHMKSTVYPNITEDGDDLVEMLTNLTVTTNGQESKLDNLIGSGKIQAASQLVLTVSAILNTESNENNTLTKSTSLEQRSLIRDSMVTSVSNSSIDDLKVLKQKAGALHSVTLESGELASSAKSKATHVFEDLSKILVFKVESKEDISPEVIENIASLILSGASNVMEATIKATHRLTGKKMIKSSKPQLKDTRTIEQASKQIKDITDTTMKVVKDVADVVLKNKVVGEEATVIQTEALSMTVMQSQPESLGNKELSVGSPPEGSTPATILLPSAHALKAAQIGATDSKDIFDDAYKLYLYQMEENPFIWDDTGDNVTTDLIGLSMRNSHGLALNVDSIAEDLTIHLPTRDIPEMGSVTLTVPIQENSTFNTFTLPEFKDEDILVLRFHVTKGETPVIKVQPVMENITLKVHVKEGERPNMDDMRNETMTIPCNNETLYRSRTNKTAQPNMIYLPRSDIHRTLFIGILLDNDTVNAEFIASYSMNGRPENETK
ncbi:unnamed protein product, partial [Owenia fusiformis]